MMLTCENCLHIEVCAYIKPDLPICSDFADRSKYVVREKGKWEGTNCSRCGGSYMDYADTDNYPAIGEPKPDFCPNCEMKWRVKTDEILHGLLNFDRCNAIGRVVDFSVDDGVCRDFDECKPQTNADRIRAMSDEELAEFLAYNWATSARAWQKDTGETLHWLQQPSE